MFGLGLTLLLRSKRKWGFSLFFPWLFLVQVLPKSKVANSQSKVKEVDSDAKKILWREAVAAPEEKLEVAAANTRVERDNKHIKLLSMSKPGQSTANNSSHPLPTRFEVH
jgi:hypothetical protein